MSEHEDVYVDDSPLGTDFNLSGSDLLADKNKRQLIKNVIEAFVFASDKPMTLDGLKELLEPEYSINKQHVRALLAELQEDYQERGIELVELAGVYRFQTRSKMNVWVQRLWEEKPQKYSRALLETLALIAYRQPITRGDIEEVRGVAVSSNIMKTLLERNWVRVIGHREVPGRPAIYATTKQFLAYFNLQSLEDLPTLAEIRDIDLISKEVSAQLELMTGDELPGDLNNDPSSPDSLHDDGLT